MPAERRAPPAWSARPWAARLLRLALILFPLLVSVAFVWLVSRWVPAPGGWVERVAWWLALSVTGTVVLLVVDRAARRLLPLAALLRLSLVFPDAAPSRFRAALEGGRVRRLEDRMLLVERARDADTPRESAQRLLALVAALSEHDRLTRGHSERVRAYSVMIGEELKLDERELDLLNWAALLHDIGKLEVDGEILRKPGRPSDAEWQEIRRHPTLGEQLVEPLRPWLGEWAAAVGYHHERWDGKGYPHGVGGEQIPLPGRIVAIADVFDVLTSARSYKDAGPAVAGREEIARCAGSQFDPRLVRAFLGVSLGRMRLVMGPLSWLAHAPVLGRLPLAPAAGTVWSTLGVLLATTGLAGSASAPAPAEEKLPLAAAQAQLMPAPERNGTVRPDRTQPSARRATDGGPAAPVVPADEPPAAPGSPDPGPTDRPAPEPEDPRDRPSLRPPPDEPEDNSLTDPLEPPVTDMSPNRPPSFTPGADQLVLEDAGARNVSAWASRISAGSPSEAGQSVSFSVSSDKPALFSAQPQVQPNGTLTYTSAADASGAASVSVRAVDDGGRASGGNDTSASHTLTIGVAELNDAPSFATGADQALTEDAGAQTVPAWATGISTGPADEAGQAVTFVVGNDNAGLFGAQPQVQPNGTLTYTSAAEASGLATLSVRAIDDGGNALGGSDTSAAQTFTISVAAVNDPPGFSPGPDQSVLIDAGPQTVGGWATGVSAGPPEEAGQSVSFDVSNDNPSLFAAQPAVAPDGTLSYTPATGTAGVATVTVRAGDDGGSAHGGSDTSAPATFTITVSEVNDPPSFTAGADQTVLEDAGAQSVAGWATGISPGPASESGQSVSFSVGSNNSGLFSAQPQVQPNGTLTYTPAANANGTATVTVQAVDDGGTDFGGDDTSAVQSFVIAVTAVNDAPSFTAGGDQVELLNVGQATHAGWASNISAGPPNEAGQAVSFVAVASNPALFSVQPQVQPDGTLTYTTAFLALGSSTVTVTAVDDGGTANGGTGSSAPQSFAITIVVG